jgi:hypothetical protein
VLCLFGLQDIEIRHISALGQLEHFSFGHMAGPGPWALDLSTASFRELLRTCVLIGIVGTVCTGNCEAILNQYFPILFFCRVFGNV